MKALYLKPVDGLLIRDPKTRQVLSKDGELKDLTIFWKRRIKDKSVIPFEKKDNVKVNVEKIENKDIDKKEENSFNKKDKKER